MPIRCEATFRFPQRTQLGRRIVGWVTVLIFLIFLFIAVAVQPLWFEIVIAAVGIVASLLAWRFLSKGLGTATPPGVVRAKKVPKVK